MIVNIPGREGDCEEFRAALCSLVAESVARYQPKDLYLTRINKWFDQKWLWYSGKGRVRFDEGQPLMDTALECHWSEKRTFPPFNPRQIEQQLYWRQDGDGTYRRDTAARPIHDPKGRSSAANLHRRIVDFSESGLFVWFTSQTATNDHGSMMMYQVCGGEVSGWYASFRRKDGWKLQRTSGAPVGLVQSLSPLR